MNTHLDNKNDEIGLIVKEEEYKDGLGPRGVQKMVNSMVPDWWIELLPTSTRGEIRSALKKINSGTEDLAQRRQSKFS